MNKFFKALPGFVLGAGCLAEQPKERTEEVKKMDEVTVVATSTERLIKETPYTVYKLDPDTLQLKLQKKSLADSLSEIPGVLLQKTGNGMTSPYLRGFTSQRTVLMSDGIKLNNSFLREGPNQYWNTIDNFFFDNVEVMMGPSSVLYGSDAIGGVVNVSSGKLDRGQAGAGLQWIGGHAVVRGATAERSLSEHIQGTFAVGDKLTLKMGVTRQDFGDLRSGDSTDNPNTGYEQWGLNLRGTYWFDNDNRIVFGFDHFDQDDVNRVHKTTEYVPWHGTTPGSDDRRIYDHDRHTAFTRYEVRNANTWFDEMDLTLSYAFMKEEFTNIRWSNKGRQENYQTKIDTIAAALKFVTDSDAGRWTYGFDFSHDSVHASQDRLNGSGRTSYDQGLVADNALYSMYGVYLQNEYEVNSRWEFITGARYSWVRLDARDTDLISTTSSTDGITDDLKGNWDALTLSGRAIYKVNPDNSFNVFAGVSQGFRAPNLSDATRKDDFGGDGVETPTADIDPEKFVTLESGLKLSGQKGYFNLTGYYTFIEDRIVRLQSNSNTGGAENKVNSDEGFIYGIEANFLYKLNELYSVFGNVAWQYGAEDHYYNRDTAFPGETSPMSRINPLTAQLGLRYAPEKSRFWAETYVNMADNQDRLSLSDTGNRFPEEGTPGYATLNVRGGYRISENTTLSAAVENIFDKEYRAHGSGVNESGVNLVLSLKTTF